MSTPCQIHQCCSLAAPPSAFCAIHNRSRLTMCSRCGGTGGTRPPWDDQECQACHGTGSRWRSRAEAEQAEAKAAAERERG